MDEKIRGRAYAIWQAEGRPVGRARIHWIRAQAELRDELMRSYPAPESGRELRG